LPGELIAAFLWAQLEEADRITNERLVLWNRYNEMFANLESNGKIRRPIIPDECQHNAHMYYILLPDEIDRQGVLDELRKHEIGAVFHYVPLHSSPAGKRYTRAHGDLSITNQQSNKLIRLPLWVGLTAEKQERVLDVLNGILNGR